MNHLPFALRTYLDVPWTPAATRRTQVKMPSLRFGGDGGRMILQDLQITPLYIFKPYGGTSDIDGQSVLLARIGAEGHGYLTEELLPLALQTNATKPQMPVWRFARPYRLDPGQKLSARILHMCRTAAELGTNQTPGLMFHGKRVKDDLPIMLYDSKDTYIAPPADNVRVPVNLTNSTFNCPQDSSVLIYAVSSYTAWDPAEAPNGSPLTNYGPLIQVFGPNGRPWSTSEIATPNISLGAAPTQSVSDWADGLGWIETYQSLIELGEGRGWVLDQKETLLVELENPNGAQALSEAYSTGGTAEGYDLIVVVTLRGCLEVPNG